MATATPTREGLREWCVRKLARALDTDEAATAAAIASARAKFARVRKRGADHDRRERRERAALTKLDAAHRALVACAAAADSTAEIKAVAAAVDGARSKVQWYRAPAARDSERGDLINTFDTRDFLRSGRRAKPSELACLSVLLGCADVTRCQRQPQIAEV